MKKTVFSKIFSTIAIMTMVFAMVPFQAAHAGGTENVVGYAFSDMPDGSDQNKPCTGIDPADTNNEHCGRGLGWISLNSINHAGSINYGVNLNRTTGNFEGHGYAEYGGWVKFNPTGPFPSGPGTVGSGAKVDPVCLADATRTCAVTGWIRFISGTSTGWDGWVSMSGTGYGLVLDKPDTNGFRKFLAGNYAWGSWIVGWVDFSNVKVRIVESNDACYDTNFVLPGDPRNSTMDPKTIGLQTIVPTGYTNNSVSGQCGIFGCPKTNPAVTIDNGSCPTCTPDSSDYNPISKKCEICNPNNPKYNSVTGTCPPNGSDVCPTTIKYDGTIDPQTTGDQTNQDVTNMGYEVRGNQCGIWGCKDPYALVVDSSATIHDPSKCTYGPEPHEICFNGIDDDGDLQVDEGCPTKGPKIPVYCETGGRNCPTGGTVQP